MARERRTPRRHTVHTQDPRYKVNQYPRGRKIDESSLPRFAQAPVEERTIPITRNPDGTGRLLGYISKDQYNLAMAAGQDAANQRMRRYGRNSWNKTDYALAARTSNKMMCSMAR